jgi:hypothetical protein
MAEDFKTVTIGETQYGFIWGGMIAERTAEFKGTVCLTLKGIQGNQAVSVYVSKTGRSIRVFRNGKEMKTSE